MLCKKNIFDQRTHAAFSTSACRLSHIGTTRDVSNPSEHLVDIAVTCGPLSCPTSPERKKLIKNGYVTAEFLPVHKKKIWVDKLPTSAINIQITKLSKILDQVSTTNERVLTPFWTKQSEEISRKLWLPTKIDCVDSVLKQSTESSQNTPMGQSWFSINKKHPQKKNSLMTSFQLSQYSLPGSMASEATPSKTKSNLKPVRTLKMRLFPTNDEHIELQKCLEQYRWYYNLSLSIISKHFPPGALMEQQHKYEHLRKIINSYKYKETHDGDVINKDYVYDETNKNITIPEWWQGKNGKKSILHSRTPRGAIKKITSNLNSGIANLKNGNIRKFVMKFRSKKSPTDYLLYEDSGYPSFIRKIKSHYWFRNRERKRTKISLSDITSPKKGLEIIYEKETNRYFLHYPVPIDWFPADDKRNDNQKRFETKGNRIISLDPGIRKFLVGYDPSGSTVFIGEGANKKLIELLYNVDKETNSYMLWKKIKNYVDEMHWKSISYLIENYDTILYPDFRISQMIRSKKLSKMTKRLMCMYSFHSFRTKLEYKCRKYNKKLIIVDESYTSCTCGVCGTINNTKGNEIFKCVSCKLTMDRDAAGSRNILLKNLTKNPTLGLNHDFD